MKGADDAGEKISVLSAGAGFAGWSELVQNRTNINTIYSFRKTGDAPAFPKPSSIPVTSWKNRPRVKNPKTPDALLGRVLEQRKSPQIFYPTYVLKWSSRLPSSIGTENGITVAKTQSPTVDLSSQRWSVENGNMGL